MSRHSGPSLVASAVALAASAAFGQVLPGPNAGASTRDGPGGAVSPGVITGMGTGTENPLVVLSAPVVRKELKLTEEQREKVDKLARDAGERARELFQAVAFGADPQLMLKRGQDLRKKSEKDVAAVLEKEQRQRLEEIMLQLEGPLAVARSEVAARLKLGRNQTQTIQATITELQVLQRQLVFASRRNAMIAQAQAGGIGAPAPGQGPMMLDDQLKRESERLREQAASQVARVLSKNQKAEFETMMGPKFDVKQIDPDLAKFAPGQSQGTTKPVRKGTSKKKNGV